MVIEESISANSPQNCLKDPDHKKINDYIKKKQNLKPIMTKNGDVWYNTSKHFNKLTEKWNRFNKKKNQQIGIKIACRKAKTEPQENPTNPRIETSSTNAY